MAPEPFRFPLPSFVGQIFPSCKVKIGKKMTLISVDTLKGIGDREDAIFTYYTYVDINGLPKLELNAIVEDPQRRGWACFWWHKFKSFPDSWQNTYGPGEIKVIENEIVVKPILQDIYGPGFLPYLTFSLISCCMGCVAIWATIQYACDNHYFPTVWNAIRSFFQF